VRDAKVGQLLEAGRRAVRAFAEGLEQPASCATSRAGC